ncbi:MAG: HypC/HybG/HupF family hydrogenase formation chaperone, partial [Candidatus Omnitrophica bacterium]|nr:HypC/HybG/HupF family hydrogenase formation chaperone [Candidatus Omnitrophota bacterium]
MCYAIPGRVESIDANIATVDYFGQRKKAINEIDGLKRGDYIYAQGGYVIEKIPRTEAEDILSTWKETFFELQELDVKISRLSLGNKSIDKKLGRIIDRALEEKVLAGEELLYLLSLNDPKELDILFKAANFLRQKYHKNACCVHGIIEISNQCSRNCHYCGISSGNKGLKRYRMSDNEIVEAACEAVNGLNFKALVLQSGEDAGYSASELASVIKEIKSRAAALIFISFGEMPREGLEKLFAAGARGILLR